MLRHPTSQGPGRSRPLTHDILRLMKLDNRQDRPIIPTSVRAGGPTRCADAAESHLQSPGSAWPQPRRWRSPEVRSRFAAMAAPTETAATRRRPAGGHGDDRPAGRRRAGAPARRDDPRPDRDRPRLPGRRQAPRPPGRGRGDGAGRRRGGDARRHRPPAAARGGRGGPLGGADRAREGRDRPRPRDDAGAQGLGQRPGHRRAHRRCRGAARAAAAGGAQRRAGEERALLRDAARRRRRAW